MDGTQRSSLSANVPAFVPGGAPSLRPAASGSFTSASALAPDFVPGGASRASSTVSLLAAAAAAPPFVPRSGSGSGSGSGPNSFASSSQEPAPTVTFLRGATRGGVPVPVGAVQASGAGGLPEEDDLFRGLAGDVQRMHVGAAGPMTMQQPALRALVQPDGSQLYVPRSLSGADAVATAVGHVGVGMAALSSGPGEMRRLPAASGRVPHSSRFSSDALRAELASRAAICAAQLMPNSEEAERTPQVLHRFHSLVPLEEELAEETPSASLGVRTAVLKAVSMDDGAAVALRRLDGAAMPPSAAIVSAAMEVIHRWSPLGGHPALCTPTGVFAADDGSGEGGVALYVVSDYFPSAVTMAQAHLQPGCPPCPEDLLWATAVQIAGALRAIHVADLAARPGALAPTKVLLTLGGRMRLSSCGLPDILAGEGAQGTSRPGGDALRSLQRGDLVMLGHLLLSLGCGAPRVAGMRPSLQVLQQRVSPRLTGFVAALLDAPGAPGGGIRDVGQLAVALGEPALAALANAHAAQDALLGELARESENGRMLRLLAKLGFVLRHNGGDGASDSGDVYLLRLFQDHALAAGVREDGAPAMDWGALYEALNKLDAGVPERLMLLSRDEASMLVASYQDIKRCVERAYAQLEQQQAR